MVAQMGIRHSDCSLLVTWLIVRGMPDAGNRGDGVDPAIVSVANRHGVSIDPLGEAGAYTRDVLARLSDGIRAAFPPGDNDGLDIVLCGSFGRGELTRSSDCDYLILVHGNLGDTAVIPKLSKHLSTAIGEEGLEPPGTQGLFGDFAVSSEMFGRIGLESDSYLNTTRRMLLLTESVSAYQPSIREAALDTLIRRYCEDYRDRSSEDGLPVPRFLLNDLLRYWRTLAVDYGAKQWRAGVQRDQLRYAKLRTSRKILFAGSLAPLLEAKRRAVGTQVYDELYEHLSSSFRPPPLARLMNLYEKLGEEGRQSLARILSGYVEFLSVIESEPNRELLKTGSAKDVEPLTEQLERIGDDIDAALLDVFFGDPYLKELTQRYGLF